MSLDPSYDDNYFCEDCWQDERDCECGPIDPEKCSHMVIELEELSDSIIWEVCQDCDKTFDMVGQFGVLWKKEEKKPMASGDQ